MSEETPDIRHAMSSRATGPLTPAEMITLAAEMEASLIEYESQFSHPDWRYVDGLRALAARDTSEAARFAMVFRAAAEGTMARYRPSSLQGGCFTYREADRTRDEATSGAFRAIGDVFAKIAEADRAPAVVSGRSNE